MLENRRPLRKKVGLVAVALICTLGPAAAWAARPLDTEDTGTAEPGAVEVELGADYVKSPGDTSWALTGVLSYGLLPKLEVRVESAFLRIEPEGEGALGGPGDSTLGVKYRVLDEAERFPAVLAALALRLPTGDEARALGADGVDVQLLAAAAKTFGPFTLTWNAGYTFVTSDADLDAWTVAGSGEYELAPKWLLVGEIVAALGARSAADTVIVRGGAVYRVTERARLDAAVGIGLTRDSPDLLVTVGVTIGF